MVMVVMPAAAVRTRAHGQCGARARLTSHTPSNKSGSASGLQLMLEVLKLML